VIELNQIFLFIALISPLAVLARAWRPGGLNRGWRVAALVVLGVTAIAYWLDRKHAGYIGAGCWLLLLFLPVIGLRKVQDELSLGFLLDLMEEVQADIAALDRTAPELPSVGVSGEIRVLPEHRQEFLNDLQSVLQDLFTRYGGAEGDAFKVAVACYPKGQEKAPRD